MKNKIVLLGIAAAMSAVSGVTVSKSINADREERDATIIVELDSHRTNKELLVSDQLSALSYIRSAITDNIKVTQRFSHAFNGFILDIPSKYVTQVRNIPGVKNVNYDLPHSVMDDEVELGTERAIHIDTKTNNISRMTMEVPKGTKEGAGTLIAILDTGFMINATYTDDEGNYHENVHHAAFTDLDNEVPVRYTEESLHALQDANPSFHGKHDADHSTYFNRKVPFYYDYGGEYTVPDYEDIHGAGEEDYDVFTLASDHGNHVASIAAGNDPFYKGIAPNAQLALMKVFTPITYYRDGEQYSSNGAYDSSILKAFEDCEILGVDVINMSLGSALNDFSAKDSITGRVIARLKNQGIEFSISAGNEGKNQFINSAYEYWTPDMVEHGILGHYAADGSATTIASSEPDMQYYETALKVGSNIVAFSDQIQNYTSSDGEVVYEPERQLTDLLIDHPEGEFDWIKIPGVGNYSDYEDAGITKADVQGKIAIVDRGDITFALKIQNAVKEFGAIAVGIIDNDPTQTDFNFRMAGLDTKTPVPVFSILYRDKSVFDNATDFTCKLFTDVIESNPKARTSSAFSSDGPAYDLSLKPDVTTPGTNILGGVYAGGPTSYEYYSGTSMAAPNYSGAYALALAEHLDDPTWRNQLTGRLMSTAVPMLDRYGGIETIRKQGAGLVNLTNALEANVILDGSSSEELSGFAKIELGNNDDVKNGILDLNFTTISNLEQSKDFNVTISIMRPYAASGLLDEENYGEKLHNATLVSTIDEVIKEVTTSVIVKPGQNVVHFRTQLSNAEKAIIDEIFEDGTYLEGYVTLEAEGETTISIPYLGFYGDYGAGIPVEPFKFERDNDRVYPSDLLNSVATKWGAKNGADYGSDWVMGNWDNLEELDLSYFISNETVLRDTVDSNKKKVIPVGTNPYTGEIETNDIYMGNNGFSNTMIIAQFVMRTVFTNTITISSKKDGKVILIDHMFDSFFGSLEDESDKSYQWPLYKSFVDPDYWSAGYIAHRAYTIIPLYNYTYDENRPEGQKYIKGTNFPDGEYNINFNYTLASGGNYQKNYTLHIDSEVPAIEEIERIEKGGEQYLRVRYNEIKMSYVSINGYKYELEEDSRGYYIDIKASDYAAGNKVFLKGYDYAGGISSSITHVDDELFGTVVRCNTFTNAYDFKQETVVSDDNIDVSFTYTKSNKDTKVDDEITVLMDLSAFLKDGGTATVTVDGKAKVSYSLNGKLLTFTGNSNSVYHIAISNPIEPTPSVTPTPDPTPSVTPTVDPTPTPEPEPKKGGCGGSIIATSALLSTISLVGIGLLVWKKKKED